MNIWYHPGYKIIPTNGNIRNDGQAVMGAGLAKQAAERYPNLAKELGIDLRASGNLVYLFPDYKIMSFPTKNNWWEDSSLSLIEKSAKQLSEMLTRLDLGVIAMPKVGCGLGGLVWGEVKHALELHLDEHILSGKIILLD